MSDSVYRVHVDTVRTDEVGHWVGTCKTRHIIRHARSVHEARNAAQNDAVALCLAHHPGTYEDDLEAFTTQCVAMPKDPKATQA